VDQDSDRDYPELRDAIRRVCARFGGAYWRDLDARQEYPTEFVNALTQDGYLAVLIPEEYGGAGLPLRAAAVILEEIHASGANAGACHAQMYTMGTLLRHGSAAQRSEFLPRIASGELRLQAFGVTEPSSGSDTTRLRTTAVRDGDEFVVNGQKVWTSRALHSDLMLLLARTTPADQVKRKTDGLSVFLVDMRAARDHGLEIRPLRAMVNHNTTEVFFRDMRVPAANLIGEVDKGFKYILDGMNAERILVAAESFGDGRWFTDTATRPTALVRVPLSVTEEPRAVVDEADQKGFDVGAAAGQHFARAVMEVEMQQLQDVLDFVAAHLALFKSVARGNGAVGAALRRPPAHQSLRLEVSSYARVRRTRQARGAERDAQVVVV
jgi:alkylation response protein AidB-like acyl-CoA dehydrogenase